MTTEVPERGLDDLWDDGEFVLSRVRRSRDRPTALFVRPAAAHPAEATIARLEHAHSLRGDLDSSWAARPTDLIGPRERLALGLEDPGGEVLATLLGKPWDVAPFLRVAVGVASALSGLHGRGLVHKDVRPSNVLVDVATSKAWLTGFGITSRLRRERQSPEPPEIIAGTLAYMAPEQTGRMNRSIDSRSDLYSLGVTLYEVLTGSLPFIASDPMAWVHCQIARRPVPPHERLKEIPFSISAILMKLLAKTAEERYQTAAGLESDLRRCLAAWKAHGRIDDFPLGEHDTLDRLLIPEKLYGRAREVETLVASFDRTVKSGVPELVVVSGYSGIGKSSVVNELHRVLVPPRGLFASGKFDQYKRDIPYSTLVQAFQSLVRPLLGKSDTELSGWRDALLEALGLNGRLMVDVVPTLKLIIGDQPPVPELPPPDAQRRFQFVLRRFIGVFARPEHPLALFLDDLQWLDAATLDLLEDLLIRSDLQHLMLIGAYRDNEVTAAHPLMRRLDAIKTAGGKVAEITMAPLAREHLGQLIGDALRCESERSAPLAQLVHEKTGGNPFFAIQFISSLADEGMLTFDHAAASWSWDLDRIHTKRYTDNVVDLMVGKLSRLPIETQNALQQLACLGNHAEITVLSVVLGATEAQLHGTLWEAIRVELIERQARTYRFMHDRVQEAAYSLIPEELRGEVHLRIGRLLAAHIPPERREEAIFEIVNQLNRGAALITAQDEREQLAEFNLMAAKRAKASTAYASALSYLVAGAALLADDGWERRRELMFGLELHRAECEFLTGALAEAEARLTMLSSRAATTIDQATVACLRVDLYTTLDHSDRAVDVCLAYLRHLGMDWSPHSTEEEARREYERTWALLGSREIEELIDLPLMSDPVSLATLDVLTKVVPPALFAGYDNLYSLATCRAVNLSLERGNTDASCSAYVALGAFIAGPRFADYDAGFRFGRLAYDLVEQRGLERFEARTYMLFGNLVMPWTKHVRAGRALIRRAFDVAHAIGDLTFATYSCSHLITNLLAVGDPLVDVQREAEQGLEFAEKARFGLGIDRIAAQLGLIRTLRGVTPIFGCFNDERFDELRVERRLSSDRMLALPECWYWIRKLQARFFAGDYVSAVEASLAAQRLLWTSPGYLETAEAHFYGALSHAASCDATLPARYPQHVQALTAHHRQLMAWAERCPENFENRAALVGAEIARIEGRELDAEGLYEKAIHSAGRNGFVHNEALANELAARFYAARGLETISHAYLRDARHCYVRWGADGKVRQLDQLYPHLRTEEGAAAQAGTIQAPVEHLDLATVLQVSQAVSGEIVLEKLVETLLRTAIEHAGAERGLLILPRGGELSIRAEAIISGSSVTVSLRETPVSAVELPESVVRYAARTQESVILDDAAGRGPFSSDEYIRAQRARSVLCVPLVKQAALVALLYLENNLAPNVFTPARIAVLKVLASEAAMSLDNSRLYRELQEREARIRQDERELRRIIDAIPQSITVLAPDGSTLDVNAVTLEYSGLSLEEIRADQTRVRRFHPEDVERLDDERRKALRRGDPFEVELRARRNDGQFRWFLIRHNPFRDASGNITRWYATGTDIEDRKQAEERVRHENLALREEIDRSSMFEEIVGSSPPLRAVLSHLSKVAPTDSTVLITGETGTGKELIARAIYKRSARSARAFISVNCAAVPASLIASELFGHEKGAFTGALQRRQGRFELADGGTLFLDEVGELPTDTQIMLLRVLQEREFERVGGTAPIRVNVRLLAATNRDLQAAVAAGTFRADLFYRLNVFPLEVPALRERRADIPLLVEYFIHRFAHRAGKRIRGLTRETSDVLQSYDWPGNIRELQNVIERAVIIADSDTLAIDERWLGGRPARPPAVTGPPPATTLATHEKEAIEAALMESKGRVSGPFGAAARLGVPSSTLESKIKAMKIDKRHFKSA
jgi:PAS domain S-box-containing protein